MKDYKTRKRRSRDIWCGNGDGLSRRDLLRGLKPGPSHREIGGVDAPNCPSARAKDFIRLAYNESPLGPAPGELDAVEEALYDALALTGINRYADFLQIDLGKAVADRHGFTPFHVTMGCGSSEVMQAAAAAFLRGGDELLLPDPTFDLTARAAEAWGASVVHVPLAEDHRIDLEALLEAVTPQTKLIYLCNPNNPTGTVLTADEIADFLGRLRRTNASTKVLFDEAYGECVDAPGFPCTPDYLNRLLHRDRVILAKSFSKIYGLAGLRAGYGLASMSTTMEMNGFLKGFFVGPLGWTMPECNVNRLAEAGVLASLADGGSHLETVKQLNRDAKAFLYGRFDALDLAYIPSEANFVMVDTGEDGEMVRDALQSRAILVQAGGDFHERYATWLRATTGTMEETTAFADALADILGGRRS